MNIESFYYFETLAEERNVTRAARKLGLTQQALSAQISRLEEYYGVRLFEREKHFELTYAGQRLLQHAQQLRRTNSNLESEMRDLSGGQRGRIVIGATAKRSFTILPLVFPAFHEEFPLVQVDSVEGRTHELLPDVLEEKTDFCFIVSETENPRISSIPIFNENIHLFVADEVLQRYCAPYRDEILARKDAPLPIEFFADCPFIMQGEDNRIRVSCERLFARHGIIPNIIFTSTNALNLVEIARLGCGVTFLNASTRSDTVPGIHRFQIEDLSEPKSLKISFLADRYQSRPVKRFIELSCEILPKKIEGSDDWASLL